MQLDKPTLLLHHWQYYAVWPRAKLAHIYSQTVINVETKFFLTRLWWLGCPLWAMTIACRDNSVHVGSTHWAMPLVVFWWSSSWKTSNLITDCEFYCSQTHGELTFLSLVALSHPRFLQGSLWESSLCLPSQFRIANVWMGTHNFQIH